MVFVDDRPHIRIDLFVQFSERFTGDRLVLTGTRFAFTVREFYLGHELYSVLTRLGLTQGNDVRNTFGVKSSPNHDSCW